MYKAAASGNENSIKLLLQTNWDIDISNSVSLKKKTQFQFINS